MRLFVQRTRLLPLLHRRMDWSDCTSRSILSDAMQLPTPHRCALVAQANLKPTTKALDQSCVRHVTQSQKGSGREGPSRAHGRASCLLCSLTFYSPVHMIHTHTLPHGSSLSLRTTLLCMFRPAQARRPISIVWLLAGSRTTHAHIGCHRARRNVELVGVATQ